MTLQELKTNSSNAWLHCIPVSWKPNLSLAKKQFNDGILLRSNILPDDLPNTCPARSCSEPFTLVHADICVKGNIINSRHDTVKIIIAKYAEKAFGTGSTVIEPTIGPIDNEAKDVIIGNKSDNARADLAINNLISPHRTGYIDVSVISPVCETNKNKSISKSITNAENRKNTSYKDRISKQLNGDFLPFVLSTGGVIGPSAKKVVNIISSRLAASSNEKETDIKRQINTDISMSLIKSRIHGLRANRNNIATQMTNYRVQQ